MQLSIVSGTYNRFAILKRMMGSVRRQMFKGMDYEFVIVDGGSTDGTLEWLRQQPDVVLIEHGELRGAIPAFCDGARAAQGTYVIMANDDITFHDNSILAAIAHLEDNPGCGAVAFADNRSTQYHQVMGHRTRDPDGVPSTTPYAQVGMFRRWLGEAAGWWGDQDDIMKNARTYGGDNYLSARIWEMGYTVDDVLECKVDDGIEQDGMRKINTESGPQDGKLFYQRYPDGPIFGAVEFNDLRNTEKLRILYLPIYEGNHAQQRQQKCGLRNALGKVGIVLEYDFVTRHNRNMNIHQELIEINRAFRPHVLFTQAHRADTLRVGTIAQLRTDNPDMIAVNWNGDYWPEAYLDKRVIELLKWYDLALVVNANVLPDYEQLAIPCAYWQVASEEPTNCPEMPAYDVLFMANAYGEDRIAFGHAVVALRDQLGISVGIYGNGWGDHANGETLYNYAASHSLMRNAKIVLGDNWFNDGSAFVSNRFFETLHSGAFLLHMPIRNFQHQTGYRVNSHYAVFEGFNDLADKVSYWLEHDDERQQIASKGQRYTYTKHSFDARVRELFLELIPEKIGRRVHA